MEIDRLKRELHNQQEQDKVTIVCFHVYFCNFKSKYINATSDYVIAQSNIVQWSVYYILYVLQFTKTILCYKIEFLCIKTFFDEQERNKSTLILFSPEYY